MSNCVQPCLLCDAPVELAQENWVSKEAPLALCEDCCAAEKGGLLNWPLIKMIYMMRCQIGALYQRTDKLDAHLREVLRTQQEMEQALLGKVRAA
jgi:hypothetical protein